MYILWITSVLSVCVTSDLFCSLFCSHSLLMFPRPHTAVGKISKKMSMLGTRAGKPGVVAHIHNLSSQYSGGWGRRTAEFRASLAYIVLDETELHGKTLPQNQPNKHAEKERIRNAKTWYTLCVSLCLSVCLSVSLCIFIHMYIHV